MLTERSIRRFQVSDLQPCDGRIIDCDFFVGGIFEVNIELEADAAGEYVQLEYRQFIRGQTLVNRRPTAILRIPVRGGTVNINPHDWIEDGDPSLGADAQYGHRTNAPADNDAYFRRDRDGMVVDMARGNLYRNYDRYGITVGGFVDGDGVRRGFVVNGALTDSPTVPYFYPPNSVAFERGGDVITLELHFKGQVIDRGPDGRLNRVVTEQTWSRGTTRTVPLFTVPRHY